MTKEIKSMWHCPIPDLSKPGAGFPILTNATHTPLYQPNREDGAYNHHPKIGFFQGHFYAMWSNHPYGEDGPGQRILYTYSSNGCDWQKPAVLFEPLGPIKPSEEKGLVLTPFKWLPLNGKLFALVGHNENIGFTNSERSGIGEVRNQEFPMRARKGHAVLGRQLSVQPASRGPVFALWDNIAENTQYTILPPEQVSEAARLNQLIRELENLPSWDFSGDFNFPRKYDAGRLCEPTIYKAKNGTVMMLLRDDKYSHRLYVSHWDTERQAWAPAFPTDIPDSPSLCCNVRLSDGTILLIGNQMAPVFDNPEQCRHYKRDPLTVSVSEDGLSFNRVFALRCGVQTYRVSDVKGRGGGGQYPSALVHEGTLYVVYSMGKEDIWVSNVALSDLDIAIGAAL